MDRKLFVIVIDGEECVPSHALTPTHCPHPTIAAVIAEAQDVSGTRLASWFESRSGYLGGFRPRELLDQPERVVAAARAWVVGPIHG